MTSNAAGKTTPRTPAQALLESRQKDSREKRAAVEQQLFAMLTDGDPITYIKVARRAKVSTWLVYSQGTREKNQRGHQQATTTQADPQQPTRRNRFPSNRSRTGQA